ncbi:MAG: hypothetical protein V4760_10390 [Bdellovibrionota bacterium]
MKKFISIAFVALLGTIVVSTAATPAQAGYREGMKGATQAEREIRWLWKYVGEIVASCARSQTECTTDPEIRDVVLKLNGYIPAFDSAQAGSWADLLQFISEKNNPGVFSSASGEAHRVMVTGSTAMSKVLVNTDRMTMPLEDQLGLLVHEAIHHLGYGDDATRLPDRIGAEVAKHFVKQLKRSSLEQFNAPEIQVVTFDTMLPNHPNIGFISWGQWTSDVDWSSSALQPLCDPNTEVMNRQEISAPSWRVQGFKADRGIVVVKGGGHVNVVCLNPRTGAFHTNRFALGASVELQYPLPFDREKWMDQTPTVRKESVALGASMNPNDHLWGQAMTFTILATQHDKTTMKAGETLRSTFRVRSIDNYRPETCQLFVVGTQYSVITQDTIPGVNSYDSCKLTKISANEWQVEGDVRIPTNARPDKYYVPLIFFQSRSEGDRDAIPLLPAFVTVENAGAPPPPVIRGLTVRGLPAAQKLDGNPLTNSYMADPGQKFEVEFIVEGKQLATTDRWFDATLYLKRPGSLESTVVHGSGSSISWPTVLTNTDVIYVTGGTRITMQWTMPTMFSGVEVMSLKFGRFYVRTFDYSWAEIEMPEIFDSMIVSSKVPH